MFSAWRQWRTSHPNAPSRLVRLQGLPTGYKQRDILKGVGEFVEQVTFHENEAEIQFFSPIHRVAFSKRWEAANLVGIKVDNPSASLIARIGHWGASRKIRFYFSSDIYTPDIIDDVKANVRSFGPLIPNQRGNQVSRFTTERGLLGFNVTFLTLADALRCDHFYGVRRERTKISTGFGFDKAVVPSDRQSDTRTVCISNLKRELVASRVLLEGLARSDNSSSGQGETITRITHSPATGTVAVSFSAPEMAQSLLDNFPATLLRARAKLVPSPPLRHFERIAIESGAGRRVALFINHPISPAELGRDFAWCGDHEVHVYADRAVLEFYDIKDAMKTVANLTHGRHKLPDKYAGALVSFAVENSIQETDPSPIAAGRWH